MGIALKEVERLSELETVIERGIQTFVEVGAALAEIRDSRLYREQYATFDAYCKERWGWSIRRAQQIMAAAHTAQRLEANESSRLPVHETHVRPLTGLPPEYQAQAWESAVERAETTNNGKVTEKIVREVVAEKRPQGGNGVKRLPAKDRREQFDRLVYSIGVTTETLADLVEAVAGRPDEDWAGSLRHSRRRLSQTIGMLEDR